MHIRWWVYKAIKLTCISEDDHIVLYKATKKTTQVINHLLQEYGQNFGKASK